MHTHCKDHVEVGRNRAKKSVDIFALLVFRDQLAVADDRQLIASLRR